MTRLRLLALLLASLVLVLPFEPDSALAERSDPHYGPPSKTFKRSQPRPRRKIHRQKPAPAASAPKRKPAAGAVSRQPPAEAPLPSPNPERPAAPVIPLPPAKPDAAGSPAQGEGPPSTAPLPAPKPSGADISVEDSKPTANEAAGGAAPPLQVPTRPVTTPPEELACRERLKGLGAEFTDEPAQSGPSGCSLPHPLLLTKLSATVAVKPGALVNCALAEATARFAQGPMSEAARTLIGEELVAIDQVSAYVCRPRHGTQKLSEHAFGNAVDFSRLTFSKGTVIEVGPVPGPAGEAFLRAVRNAACGPFKTVLGPGSDADHARHLHLDLAPRRNGGTFCQ